VKIEEMIKSYYDKCFLNNDLTVKIKALELSNRELNGKLEEIK